MNDQPRLRAKMDELKRGLILCHRSTACSTRGIWDKDELVTLNSGGNMLIRMLSVVAVCLFALYRRFQVKIRNGYHSLFGYTELPEWLWPAFKTDSGELHDCATGLTFYQRCRDHAKDVCWVAECEMIQPPTGLGLDFTAICFDVSKADEDFIRVSFRRSL